MLYKIFPFLTWIKQLKDPKVLRADMIAGSTVAMLLIPQSMAYAAMAGLPEAYGLYIAFVPVVVAALWGSSKQLGSGPVALLSMMTATTLYPLVESMLGRGAPQDQFIAMYISMAMFLAFMVGIFQFSLGVFKLGAIVNFFSHPVSVGFTNAVALFIVLTEMPKIFGLELAGDPSDHFLSERIGGFLDSLGNTHGTTFLIGISSLLLLIGIKRYLPRLPNVLIAVVIATFISKLIGFETLGGAVVRHIPQGLPEFIVPDFSFEAVSGLFLGAIFIAFVGFMQAIAIAKNMAAKTKDNIDPNQELIGQGMANIVGSLFQAYPASGSFSRSALNFNAGGKTGFSSLVTALLVAITLLFLTPLFYHLPRATLAAVVITSVVGLMNMRIFIHIWMSNKHDGIAAVATFAFTLGFAPNIMIGILIGLALAIGLYLYRTMRPRVAILGRYPDGTLRDVEVYRDLPTDDNIIAIRFDGSLYFANVSYFEEAIHKAVLDKPGAKYLLVVGDAINQLDASGEMILRQLVRFLNENQITVVFSGLKRQILNVLRKTRLYNEIGEQHIFPTEDMALAAIYDWMGVDAASAYCPLIPGSAKPA